MRMGGQTIQKWYEITIDDRDCRLVIENNDRYGWESRLMNENDDRYGWD